jgi:hypothetical protein
LPWVRMRMKVMAEGEDQLLAISPERSTVGSVM